MPLYLLLPGFTPAWLLCIKNKKIMDTKKKNTDTKEETKADDYDKEKEATNQNQPPSTNGDSKSGNKVLLEQAETD